MHRLHKTGAATAVAVAVSLLPPVLAHADETGLPGLTETETAFYKAPFGASGQPSTMIPEDTEITVFCLASPPNPTSSQGEKSGDAEDLTRQLFLKARYSGDLGYVQSDKVLVVDRTPQPRLHSC